MPAASLILEGLVRSHAVPLTHTAQQQVGAFALQLLMRAMAFVSFVMIIAIHAISCSASNAKGGIIPVVRTALPVASTVKPAPQLHALLVVVVTMCLRELARP